jgi:hypothetical protein
MGDDTRSILTALSGAAGAIAAASAAHAAIITDNAVGISAGFGGSYGTGPYSVSVNGLNLFNIQTTQYTSSGKLFELITLTAGSGYFMVKTTAQKAAGAPSFYSPYNVPTPAPGGATFTNFAAATSYVSQPAFLLQVGGSEQLAPSAGTHYYLFEFNPGTGLKYGWFSANLADSGAGNFGVSIDQLAYDSSGATISVPSVPEPNSMGLLAFGALVTGAVGTRRLKRALRG